MTASRFEYRRQLWLHLLLVGLALSTYLINPDDIVWALLRYHSNSAILERVIFGVGALLALSSAILETGSFAARLRLSRVLFALALGLLIPLPGAIVLIVGETILVSRLLVFDRQNPGLSGRGPGTMWSRGFRRAFSKWGVAASMMSLSITLQDRLAEIIAATAFVVWLALNLPEIISPTFVD